MDQWTQDHSSPKLIFNLKNKIIFPKNENVLSDETALQASSGKIDCKQALGIFLQLLLNTSVSGRY